LACQSKILVICDENSPSSAIEVAVVLVLKIHQNASLQDKGFGMFGDAHQLQLLFVKEKPVSAS